MPAIYLWVEILRRRPSPQVLAVSAVVLATVFTINFRVAMNMLLLGAVIVTVIHQLEGADTLLSAANSNAEAIAPALLDLN